MIQRILRLLSTVPITSSLFKVNHFFISSHSSNKQLLKLHNNFVFQHACATPLTVLECALDTVDHAQTKKERAEAVQIAQTATRRITQLIHHSTQNAQEEIFSIHSALQEVAILFQKKHSCKIHFESTLSKKTTLFGNRLYLQESIVCLLNNAIEAYNTEEQKKVALYASQTGNTVVIHIIDFAKGMGILAQKIALYQGVSYKSTGLGLGLFFTKQTIEDSFNGELMINSKLGMGTQVKITLPIQEPCTQIHEQS